MKVTGPGGPTPPTAAEGVEEVPKGESVQATVEAQTDPVAQLARQIEAGGGQRRRGGGVGGEDRGGGGPAREGVGAANGEGEGGAGRRGPPESTRAELRAALDALAEEDPYVAELLAQMG